MTFTPKSYYLNTLAAALVIAMPSAPLAETITFQTDEDVLIVRGRDSGGDARYEFLAQGEHRLQCVALDAAGSPLAVETTFSDSGFVRFQDLDITRIARVVCQRR